ncbi:hypothetical protein JG688_00016405 [Phytophthora aleatoria]|uniref:Uncharacterized protein n=1 Tax=Phytophthora aleatoria TaxID=2496075 RepID=A0A8J5LYZ5_9STRA|nr:hypothetical protein JG688_00016405 [Phytophthora aleatoria]
MSLKYSGLGESRAIQLGEQELIERNGLIHVLVVVPVSTRSPDFQKFLGQIIEDVLDAHDEKRDVYSFVECLSVKVDELKQNLGLSLKLIDVAEDRDSSAPGFTWSEDCEAGELTMCTTYVETQLHDVFCLGEKPRYFLENSQSYKSLLSINNAKMEFTVKGTTDMAIVDAQTHKITDWAVGLCFVIEIKKDLVDNFEYNFRQFCLN